MGTGRHGPNRPREIREQPLEPMPSLETRLKIQKLQSLRSKIALARASYLVTQSRENEVALNKLIREEADLSDDVGFGANPDVSHHTERRRLHKG